MQERAILAPTNKHVNEINFQIQQKLPGDAVTYKSIDTVVDPDEAVNYPIEFLNWNLNPPRLCNGTRLSVKKLMPNLIEGTILTGKGKGEVVLIPRIPMIPTDMPFQFKRLQYPVRLSFAISINKAQGQTLKVCGLNLEQMCFSHGQLYVGCLRVGTPNSLFIRAENGKTKNVVYPNVLD